MATYSRAGQFSGTVAGAPRETPIRVLDASGSDAVLWADASKNKSVGPVVYVNESGVVAFYADPGTYTLKWSGGTTTVTVTGGTADTGAKLAVDLAGGTLNFSDGTSAGDTNLYRNSAGVLATDASLFVGSNIRHFGTGLGFYSAAAAAKPTITGSRGGNAALASLITALATLGLVTDSTTA